MEEGNGTTEGEGQRKRKRNAPIHPSTDRRKRAFRADPIFIMKPEGYTWHGRALNAIRMGCNLRTDGGSVSYAGLLLHHLLEFLQCCAYFPDRDLWPPRTVDEAWRGILVDTGLYSSMCAHVGNSLFPPVPNLFVHRIPEEDRREERVARFLESYRDLHSREFLECLLGYEIAVA